MKHDLKPVRVYCVNDGGGYFDQMDEYAEPSRIGADYYYREEVDALLEGIGGGWIKCAERMPPEGVPVLVYGPNVTHYRAGMACTGAVWDRDGWGVEGVSGYEWETTVEPTHWQPLPEPPND